MGKASKFLLDNQYRIFFDSARTDLLMLLTGRRLNGKPFGSNPSMPDIQYLLL